MEKKKTPTSDGASPESCNARDEGNDVSKENSNPMDAEAHDSHFKKEKNLRTRHICAWGQHGVKNKLKVCLKNLEKILSPQVTGRFDNMYVQKQLYRERFSVECIKSTIDLEGGERIFRPVVDGSLITQLGTGVLSRRVFVIRTPTRLTENVITSQFSQTRYTDVIALLDLLNVCSCNWNQAFLGKRRPLPSDEDLVSSFWPRALIWDFPIHRAGFAAEFPKLKKLVLTYRLLDVGSPTLSFVESLCGSLLFWLNISNNLLVEETYAIISFYEADSIFLSLLGCILTVLDSNSGYSIDTSHIENVLADASRFVEQPSVDTCKIKGKTKTTSVRSAIYDRGILSWHPLDLWRPSSARFMRQFHRALDGTKNLIHASPYKLKSLFIKNFVGPTSSFVIEIYQLYDVAVADGESQRDHVTDEVLLQKNGTQWPYGMQTTDTSLIFQSNSGTEQSDFTASLDVIPLKPWRFWKSQQRDGCLNSTTKQSALHKRRDKKSFKRWSLEATKRFFLSTKSSNNCQSDHLFGNSGYQMRNITHEDASLQLRLLADQSNYTFITEEVNQNETTNVVADFSNLTFDENVPMSNKRPVILCGDVLIVLRQKDTGNRVAYSDEADKKSNGLHSSSSAKPSSAKSSSAKSSSKTFPQKGKQISTRVWPMHTPHINSLYDYERSIFAIYAFHTGFLEDVSGCSLPEVCHIHYKDFDIRDSHKNFISEDLEMVIISERVVDVPDGLQKQVSAFPSIDTQSEALYSPCSDSCRSASSPTPGKLCSLRPRQASVSNGADFKLASTSTSLVPCPKTPQCTHCVAQHLEPYRWNTLCVKPLERDIESFLRYHPVKPNEAHLVLFLKQGYSLFSSVLALKITDNDAWYALQFFLRLPQVDTQAPNCMIDCRYTSKDNMPGNLFTFPDDAFDFGQVKDSFVGSAKSDLSLCSRTEDVQGNDKFAENELREAGARQSSTSMNLLGLKEEGSERSDHAIHESVSSTNTLGTYPGRPPPFTLLDVDSSADIVTNVELRSRDGYPGIPPSFSFPSLTGHDDTTVTSMPKQAQKGRTRPPSVVPQLLKQPNRPPLGRKIYWKPLRASNIQGTIFEEISADEKLVKDEAAVVDVSSLVDSSHLNRLFVKTTPTVSPLKKDIQKQQPQKRILFDSKRAQNISIVLARISQPMDRIAENLHILNVNFFTVDELQRLQPILLSSEEDHSYTLFFNRGGTKDQLREVPEQKLLHLRPSATFRIPESCIVFMFLKNYEPTLQSLHQNLETIRKATHEVRKSQRFRQMLSVILRWGNYVNYGVANGDLYIRGFTLGSLLKFMEFKTIIDVKITALHYLAANLIKTAPELKVEHLRKDMPTIGLAAKVSSDSMRVSLESISEGLNLIRSELQHNQKILKTSAVLNITKEMLEKRIERLLFFEKESSQKLTSIKDEYIRVKKEAYNTARFFGDDCAHQTEFNVGFPHEGFFGTLHNFVTKFTSCCEELMRNPAKLQVLLSCNSEKKSLNPALFMGAKSEEKGEESSSSQDLGKQNKDTHAAESEVTVNVSKEETKKIVAKETPRRKLGEPHITRSAPHLMDYNEFCIKSSINTDHEYHQKDKVTFSKTSQSAIDILYGIRHGGSSEKRAVTHSVERNINRDMKGVDTT